ncbi:MAG TPA: hypothetical protein VF615_22820 [Longimicrobiaceae bacterium]|jgi:hypothetical protein
MYVIKKQVVAASLNRLRSQRTHPLFAGYLHLHQRASILNKLSDLQPEFVTFYRRFFYVNNHPLGAPYIKPFTEQKASAENLWLNENIAGSYAPSSLRPGKPFRQVVNIEGKRYSLRDGHAQLALEHLLYTEKVQVADLAVFLYRNYGLMGDNPSIEDIVDVFAYEFGYSSEPNGIRSEDFFTLYSADSARDWGEDWLELT